MKLLLLFTLLSACCYGQTPVNWNSGSNSVMIAFPVGSGSGHNNGSFYSKVDTGKGDTTQRATRTKPRYRKDAIGAYPLRNVQQSQPKIYNEATPKVLSLEEKLLLYAQECDGDTLICYKRTEFPDYYFIQHAHYSEMVTKEELEAEGYRYKYRFTSATNAATLTEESWQYYFVKTPTLEGFVQYLKKK